MKKSKSVTERLQNIKLQSALNNTRFKNNGDLDEYPKLRRPKPETLLKIQGHQKVADISMSMTKVVTNIEGKQNVEVPLHNEFINKKEQIEKVTTSEIKKCELQKSRGNMLNHNILCTLDSDEAQPLTLHTALDLPLSKINSSQTDKKTIIRPLNNSEQLFVNIFYTKVNAHPHGLFAENLPDWYKKTFNKDLNFDWLELLQASNKFDIEEIQNKVVLYTKEIKEYPIANNNLNALDNKASKTETGVKDVSKFKTKECVIRTEPSVGVVRYKHLQISLQDYAKNADCDKSYAAKNYKSRGLITRTTKC